MRVDLEVHPVMQFDDTSNFLNFLVEFKEKVETVTLAVLTKYLPFVSTEIKGLQICMFINEPDCSL